MAKFSTRLSMLVLGTAFGLAACATDHTAEDGEVSLLPATPEARAPMPDSLEPALIVLSEFEGFYDGTTGEFVIEPVYGAPDELQSEGELRTVNQPLYCRRRSANDGNPNTNPPNTVEVYTIPGTINSSAAGISPANAFCVANNTGNGVLFEILGVFCATVRVSNYFPDALTEVYAVVDVQGDDLQFAPYIAPYGNGATVPDGLLPELVGLTSFDGIWSYGNLAPSGSPGFQAPVTWSFRFGDPLGSFRFIGRVISRGPTEVCGNEIARAHRGLRQRKRRRLRRASEQRLRRIRSRRRMSGERRLWHGLL